MNNSSKDFDSSALKVCEACRNNKGESEIVLCEICGLAVCGSCASTSENSYRTMCGCCEENFTDIFEKIAKKTQELKHNNRVITGKIISQLKEIQENKIRLRMNIQEIKKIEETKAELQLVTGEFKNSIKNLIDGEKLTEALQEEIAQEKKNLEEKDRIVESMSEQLEAQKKVMNEYKKFQGDMPKNYGGFMLENQKLLEKLKDIEHDHFSLVQETIESFKILKNQIITEQNEDMKLTDSGSYGEFEEEDISKLEQTENLEDIRNTYDSLREELINTIREKNSLMRNLSRRHKKTDE